MKLIVLTDRYAPEARAAAYLCCGLAEGLVQLGHDVTVLTRYPTKFVPGDGRVAVPATEICNGVKVARVASLFSGSSPLLRGLDQVAVSIGIGIRLLRAHAVDAVLVSSPPLPLTIAAILAKRLRGTPYVIHLHDLYPQTAIDLGMLRNRLLIGLMRWIERAAYRNSGRIITAAPATLDILGAFPCLGKGHVTFVNNFVDMRHCEGPDRGAAFRELWKVGKEFVVLYAGLMGHAQDMAVILECARRCRVDRPDWRFVLAGDGVKSESVRLAAAELPNVKFLGCLPNREYFAVLQACDVALITLDPALRVPAVPGKVPTIMASGRPFVAAVPEGNDTRGIAAESRAGLAINAGRPDELMQALDILYLNPELRQEMGARGKKFAREHFSLAGALPKFERELRFVAGTTRKVADSLTEAAL